MSLAKLTWEWLQSNDPKKAKYRVGPSPRLNVVKYKASPLADATDPDEIAASKAHAKQYKNKKGKGRRSNNKAHCANALWLIDRRNFAENRCLILPGAHPNRLATVRYNCNRMPAARAMCIIAHGLPSSEEMFALHLCGNGHHSCVNPKHLKWGTYEENMMHKAAHAALPPDASLSDKIDAALKHSMELE